MQHFQIWLSVFLNESFLSLIELNRILVPGWWRTAEVARPTPKEPNVNQFQPSKLAEDYQGVWGWSMQTRGTYWEYSYYDYYYEIQFY